ncbi:uncharacterized protein RBU57_007207 [Macrochelys suwanniensis]
MAPADDPDAFLGTFEQVALGAGWDRATWALRLGPYLTGEAQAAYMALTEVQARDYAAVKAAILDCLGLSAEKYRQKFRAARWAGGMQPWAFAQKLTDWATRWLRPDAHTVAQLMDQVILEQFVQRLPDSVRVWVRRHQPATLEAAVQRTEEYAEANFLPREHRTPRDLEGARKPREHPGVKLVDKRREEPKGTPSRPGQLICWRCGQPGHRSRDCPVMECGAADFCGWTKVGGQKKRRGLATIPVRVGKRPLRGLVDTASTCSLVQRRFVKPHWLIPGDRMLVDCIHGDREYCPVAQVPLEVQGKFAWKRVGVIEGLAYPVVLGVDWNPSPKKRGKRRTPKQGRERDLETGDGARTEVDPGRAESPQPPGEETETPRQESQGRDPAGVTKEEVELPRQDPSGEGIPQIEMMRKVQKDRRVEAQMGENQTPRSGGPGPEIGARLGEGGSDPSPPVGNEGEHLGRPAQPCDWCEDLWVSVDMWGAPPPTQCAFCGWGMPKPHEAEPREHPSGQGAATQSKTPGRGKRGRGRPGLASA